MCTQANKTWREMRPGPKAFHFVYHDPANPISFTLLFLCQNDQSVIAIMYRILSDHNMGNREMGTRDEHDVKNVSPYLYIQQTFNGSSQ